MASFLKIAVVYANPEDMNTPDTSDQHSSSPATEGESGGFTEPYTSDVKELGQPQQESTSGKSDIALYQGHTSAVVPRYSDQSKEFTKRDFDSAALTDGINALKIHPERATEADVNHDATESTNSRQTLSTDDLSVDARACKLPKRKPKNAKLKSEKLAEQEGTKFDFEKDKEIGISDKNTKGKSNDDMEDFIRNLVQKQVSKKHEIKFYDAAIVYDKNDYDEVLRFRNELINIVQYRRQEDIRIELFDSEEFAQSKVMVVEDVIDRCSVVLVYLSSNFTSPELHLFTEEAIGLSRFGYNDPEFQTRSSTSQKQWVLKPVHTKPRKSRDYKTPVGLLTVNGIDWFDRTSEHTMNQIISIMRLAVNQRKQRDMEVNTNNAYKDVFGRLPDKPQLGPPFNRTHKLPSVKMTQTPAEQPIHPLVSHPSHDAMSFSSGESVFQAFPNYYSAIRVDTQPSLPHDAHRIPMRDTGSLRISSDRSFGGSMAAHGHNRVIQPTYESRHLSQAFLPFDVHQQYGGYTDQPVGPPSISGLQLNQQSLQTLPGSQLGYIHQSAGLQNESYLAMQQGQIPIGTNYQSMSNQTGPAAVFPPQMGERQPQTPVHAGPYNPFQGQYMSQDALQSVPENYMVAQRNDTHPSTQMSVVSKVTGDLIVKSNLSTDDDVEVDTSYTDPTSRTTSAHTMKDQSRGGLISHDTEDDTEDSECSSDSDSDEDFPKRREVVKKVVNIVGCKTVQLGMGNRVRETEKKRMVKENMSKKSALTKQSTCQETTDEAVSNFSRKQCDGDSSNLAMNISISEDNMSLEKGISRDHHSSINDGYLLENMNRFSSAEDGETRNVCAEKINVIKSNTKLQTFQNINVDNKQKAKLRLSVNRQSDSEKSQTNGETLFSPDDNISEEELFGTGLTEIDENIDSNRSFAPPFSFSQRAQKTSNFKHIVHVNLNKTKDQTIGDKNSVYSEID